MAEALIWTRAKNGRYTCGKYGYVIEKVDRVWHLSWNGNRLVCYGTLASAKSAAVLHLKNRT